jgi:hypothetical protein
MSGNKREDWIQARMTELLPVPYFHVVLPYQLVVILWLYISQKIVYDTLFEATWETLQQFKTREVQMGMIAVLHLGQQLVYILTCTALSRRRVE